VESLSDSRSGDPVRISPERIRFSLPKSLRSRVGDGRAIDFDLASLKK
jgi:hypothetical protein